jgi:hypothetical protein
VVVGGGVAELVGVRVGVAVAEGSAVAVLVGVWVGVDVEVGVGVGDDVGVAVDVGVGARYVAVRVTGEVPAATSWVAAPPSDQLPKVYVTPLITAVAGATTEVDELTITVRVKGVTPPTPPTRMVTPGGEDSTASVVVFGRRVTSWVCCSPPESVAVRRMSSEVG